MKEDSVLLQKSRWFPLALGEGMKVKGLLE